MQQSWESKALVPERLIEQCEYWDSDLEFTTYQQLKKDFPTAKLTRQHKFLILPATNYFHPWTWKVDFKILVPQGDKRIYVECKGKWLLKDESSNEFARMLQSLEFLQPSIFASLYFCGSEKDAAWKIPHTEITVYPYSELIKIINGNN